MEIHAVSHPKDLAGLELERYRAVVIDVLRASSTIATALDSGARRLIPVATEADALAAAETLNEPGALLGGERRGLRIPGFDLGNSPAEYTSKAVAGRTIVFTTTNGTRALLAASSARECLVGCLLNVLSVADYLARLDDDVVVVPAGRVGKPVLDDEIAAGLFIDKLAHRTPGARRTQAARQMQGAYRPYRARVLEGLRESPSGRALDRAGLSADIADCARIGRLDVVPRYSRGEIIAVS